MNAIKRVCILSFSLLAACAGPKQQSTIEPTQGTTGPTSSSSSPATTSVTPSEPVISANPSTMQMGKKGLSGTISSWSLSGAMAVKRNNKGWTASLNWQQQGINSYLIRLSGPLGGGTVLIEKNGSVITYKDGPKTITSKNADELLQRQTGIRLPVNNLYYWVRGIPAPGAQTANRDQYGRLTTLKQAGYTINYENYMMVQNRVLPSKIRLQGPDVLIKLIIKSWSI